MVTAPNDKGDNSNSANNCSEVVPCENVSGSQNQDIASGQKTNSDKNVQLEYCKFKVILIRPWALGHFYQTAI